MPLAGREDAENSRLSFRFHFRCVGVYIEKLLISWSAAMWASGPAAAARPVEAGLGPARDGWPPTSALALLVKMAAVAIAATVVQSYSAQASVVCCRISHTRAPRDPRRSARA